jgi:transposase
MIRKTIKIPVHFATTKLKQSILDNTTERITFCIQSISSLITDDTELTRKNIRLLARKNKVAETTKLSAGFVAQCIDKTIWSWKSYKKLHDDWLQGLQKTAARDDEAYFQKYLQKEPTSPDFNHKTSCRIDERTGRIQNSKRSKLSPLWVHLSTLKKGRTVDIPLNPARYHLKQLKNAEIKDFEIIRTDGKYQVHISIQKEIENKHVSSVGGIDQGLNHSAGIVLLPSDEKGIPFEGLICDERKQKILQKYDELVSALQNAKRYGKLKQLRNKRLNIAKEYDWQIANQIAKTSGGILIGIGDTDFRHDMHRENGNPDLRKRIGKWSYSRQRQYIALRRAENGYDTLLVSERGSNDCHVCGSPLVTRKWLPSGESYILCHSCGLKKDADINASYNIAYNTASQCQDERLKAQMTMWKTHVSAQHGHHQFIDEEFSHVDPLQ